MGLDSVEIVMLWEESLAVTFTNEEAMMLETPQMVTDLLATKLNAEPGAGGRCLTQRAFHRLRHALSSAAGVNRSDIRPAARLCDLVSRRDRRSTWEAVRDACGIPSLPGSGWSLGFWFTPMTVGDLSRWVVTHAAHALKPPHEHWTRSEIRTVVRSVVTEICGARDFSDDDHFVRDIGIG